ncbi:DUF2533 family protein [Bacillus sp. FJAT-42376]|uniref:DUF2533 family protein n=1 Tax=Bacillus sp. FJAT-42376 TaxID=2014076 RepID=UPI000F508BAE|nr:DUF2533 family protein [Bacillus sp. FJAT-42376]AZB43277.1 DUF2533 family protein [Bacillus sp. FJAT-42376]
MEEVHKAISRHSQGQHDEVQAFIRLDGEREQKIEEAILKCREREPFSVAEINEITGKMNSLAGKVNLPMRKTVTEEMVREFVEKKSRG